MITFDALLVFTTWLENASDEGVNPTGITPAPFNCAVNVLVEASSLTVSAPALWPSTVGVNVTEIVQLSLAPSVFGDKGHVEVCAKLPEVTIPEIVKGVA